MSLATALMCSICESPLLGPYADGRERRYCSRRCRIEAGRLWNLLTNRRFRLSALDSPSCRLPEAERSELIGQVRAEICDLESRLGVRP